MYFFLFYIKFESHNKLNIFDWIWKWHKHSGTGIFIIMFDHHYHCIYIIRNHYYQCGCNIYQLAHKTYKIYYKLLRKCIIVSSLHSKQWFWILLELAHLPHLLFCCPSVQDRRSFFFSSVPCCCCVSSWSRPASGHCATLTGAAQVALWGRCCHFCTEKSQGPFQAPPKSLHLQFYSLAFQTVFSSVHVIKEM